MTFVDYTPLREMLLYTEPDSIKVLNLFLEKRVHLNEFQAKFLFGDNRQQGYTYLSILRIIKYILENEVDEITIYFDGVPRGADGADTFIQMVLNDEFSRHDKIKVRENFAREFYSFISDFREYIEVIENTRRRVKIKKIKDL